MGTTYWRNLLMMILHKMRISSQEKTSWSRWEVWILKKQIESGWPIASHDLLNPSLTKPWWRLWNKDVMSQKIFIVKLKFTLLNAFKVKYPPGQLPMPLTLVISSFHFQYFFMVPSKGYCTFIRSLWTFQGYNSISSSSDENSSEELL